MFYFKDDEKLTVYFADTTVAVWSKDDPKFDFIYALCLDSKYQSIQANVTPVKLLMDNNSKVVVTDDSITVNDVQLNDAKSIVGIIRLLKQRGVIDSDIEAIKPFLWNLIANPFGNKAIELYDFIKNADYEITEDGCFLAYKHVDYYYKTRNNFDNPIGEYVEEVNFDTNRNNLCSSGLHFCAKAYGTTHGSNGRWLIVKVNPRDVIAITPDCDGTKGRARGYLIVGEIGSLSFDNVNVEDVVDDKFRDIKIVKEDRIAETARQMKLYNNNKQKVADKMNISVATVERNMRKFRLRNN